MDLTQINNQLKPGGMRLEPRGKKQLLRIISVLPSKDHEHIRIQQKISLNLSAGIPYQLKEAHRIALQLLALKTDKWDWNKAYIIIGSENKGEKTDLELAIGSYIDHRRAMGISEPMIEREYKNILSKLIAISDRPSLKLFQEFIGQYPKDSSTRKNAYECCKRLCDYHEWSYKLKDYRSTYNQSMVKARILPTLEEILENDRNFTGGDEWRWIYRVIVCYGLRPHEAHFATVSPKQPYECFVERGKTGSRTVYPYPPTLVTKWQLWNRPKKPSIDLDRTFAKIGQITTESLKRSGIHQPYNYRHAYSLRGHIEYKQPARIMAELLGHSVETWLKVYSKWLSDDMLLDSYMKSIEHD